VARSTKPSLGGSLAYLLLAPVPALFWWILLPLTVLGTVLVAIWIGIPILMFVTMCWRAPARMERRWLRTTLGMQIPTPYRPPPPGSVYRRWRVKIRDPATWRDMSYVLLRLPLSIIEFSLTVAFWAASLGLLAMPVFVPLLPADSDFSVPNVHGQLTVVHEAGTLPWAALGLLLLFFTIGITPRIAQLQGVIARLLLGPTRTAELAARADRLQSSRARGVDAAEAERRRIERDLHDGAQQRLVALAMALGRAKTKLDNDPEALRALIDEAHTDAKLAVAELRDLARGIYPAVLGDRGLDAALSALAARCPVEVDVQVETRPRPPAAVESNAYFIVAETLTNVVKHAQAEHVRIRVKRMGDSVRLEIWDDGRGGAIARPGGGLAGLADRAATIDGVLTVTSPVGGPTVIRADLPCEW
jgi:signal transduction histidine kinase